MSNILTGLNVTRLSKRTWKIVEEDSWGQYPFIYVIEGDDKMIVIDTGTGQHNVKRLLDAYMNPKGLPYLILLTHIHFDHIGGVKYFTAEEGSYIDVCLASSNKPFSNNYEINCLSHAHSGVHIGDFKVTRWLEEGDIIYLDDNDKDNLNKQIQVIYTPGHTPDSSAFWYRREKRLFIGDTVYPFTVIHLDCLGSDFNEYTKTINKLSQFCRDHEEVQVEETKDIISNDDQESTIQNDDNDTHYDKKPHVVEETDSSIGNDTLLELAIKDFCSTLGLSRADLELQFDLSLLLELCDYSVQDAIQLYFEEIDSISVLFPPKQSPAGRDSASSAKKSEKEGSFNDTIPAQTDNIKLGCGHVESDLSASAFDDILAMIDAIKAKALYPVKVEDDYAEYSNGQYSLMMKKL